MTLYWFGPLSAFMSSVTWAIGSGRYSQLTKNNSAFSVNFSRALFALPVILFAAIASGGGFSGLLTSFQAIQGSQIGWLSASVFASYGFGDSMFFFSTKDLGVSSALAIASIFPIWTAMAGYFFKGELLSRYQAMGLFIAVSGVIFVIVTGARESAHAPRSRKRLFRGVALALTASLMWTLNSYAISQGAQGIPVALGNSIRMAMALFFVAIVSRLLGYRGKLMLSSKCFKSVWWVFFMETCLGSCFYVYGLVHSSLAVAATLTSLAPILSVPVAIALKIERFSFLRTFGIALVVLGLCFLVGGSAPIG